MKFDNGPRLDYIAGFRFRSPANPKKRNVCAKPRCGDTLTTWTPGGFFCPWHLPLPANPNQLALAL